MVNLFNVMRVNFDFIILLSDVTFRLGKGRWIRSWINLKIYPMITFLVVYLQLFENFIISSKVRVQYISGKGGAESQILSSIFFTEEEADVNIN
jgi:hypothetical protein